MIAILLADTRGTVHQVFHVSEPCSPQEIAGLEECARCYGFTIAVHQSVSFPSISDVCAEVADLTDASTSEVDAYVAADRSQPAVEVHPHSGSPEATRDSDAAVVIVTTSDDLDEVLDQAFASMDQLEKDWEV